MRIAVLFDGAGLARLGLEQAGHDCTGYEIDPMVHMLSTMVGSGKCFRADARDVDLSEYDAVWASPPCQLRSSARTQGPVTGRYVDDLLDWALALEHNVLWVENVPVQGHDNGRGVLWNAAQFGKHPRQNRNRVIGGRYARPAVSRMFARYYPDLDLCPCITASEYKGCASDKRRASRWYQRRLSIEECAWHQGFEIPSGWYDIPEGMRPGEWRRELYTAIGNGVPVWMAEAFGRADGPVLPAPIIPERGRYYRLSNGEAVRVLDLVVQKLIPTGVEHRVLWKATDDTKHYEKASQFRPRIMEEIGAELFESQRYD